MVMASHKSNSIRSLGQSFFYSFAPEYYLNQSVSLGLGPPGADPVSKGARADRRQLCPPRQLQQGRLRRVLLRDHREPRPLQEGRPEERGVDPEQIFNQC